MLSALSIAQMFLQLCDSPHTPQKGTVVGVTLDLCPNSLCCGKHVGVTVVSQCGVSLFLGGCPALDLLLVGPCATSPFRGSSSLLTPISLTSLTLGSPGRFLCVGFGGFAVCSLLPFPGLKLASPRASDPSEAASGVMARGVIPCPAGLLVHTGSILRALTDGPVPTRVTLVWKLHSLLQGLCDAHQRGAQVIQQPIKTIKREEWKRKP